jgi:monolysocardiolipin acyltransferase
MGCVSIPLIVIYCTRVDSYYIYSGRILMEAKLPPVVIPMWITGFDQLMPEGRSFPYKYLPRIGARLGVTFGNPISENELLEALHSNASQSITSREPSATGPFADNPSTALIRQRVTAIIHREVEQLGISTTCIDSK